MKNKKHNDQISSPINSAFNKDDCGTETRNEFVEDNRTVIFIGYEIDSAYDDDYARSIMEQYIKRKYGEKENATV